MSERLLDSIDGPEDLHGLDDEQLQEVAQEMRAYIIDTIGEIGGPFGRDTRRAFALHVLDELIHHGAEAALLRDERDAALWRALGALSEQSDNKKFEIILTEVRQKVNEGSSLADTLAKYPRLFPELYTNMVRSGEAAGNLDAVLARLSDFLDAQQFSKLLYDRGISNDDTVILYGGNNNWFAAYAYWYFKLYGHAEVKLLDGGRKK